MYSVQILDLPCSLLFKNCKGGSCYGVCARRPCRRTKTIEDICIKIDYICHRKIIVLFWSSNMAVLQTLNWTPLFSSVNVFFFQRVFRLDNSFVSFEQDLSIAVRGGCSSVDNELNGTSPEITPNQWIIRVILKNNNLIYWLQKKSTRQEDRFCFCF